MTAVVAPLESLESREDVAVVVEAPDLEILLVDWLNAVIYEMATRRMLFRDFRVESPAAAFAARHSASRSTGSVTPRRSS
jgi:tRNA nucleotidyltransferase (CCA-adding enzyme)